MTAEKLSSLELHRLMLRGLVGIKLKPDNSHRDQMRAWREKRKGQKSLATVPAAGA